jgi:hypothetical protein
MKTETILFDVKLPECGHRLVFTSEDGPDGTWSLHVYAPCDTCEKVAVEAVRSVFKDPPVIRCGEHTS